MDGSAIAGTPPTEWTAADVPSGILSFNTVNTACADSTEGGHSDWRLPKLWELSKHYVDGNTNPILVSTAGHQYWTDTPLSPSDPNTLTSVYMENGGIGAPNKLFAQLHGRCVR